MSRKEQLTEQELKTRGIVGIMNAIATYSVDGTKQRYFHYEIAQILSLCGSEAAHVALSLLDQVGLISRHSDTDFGFDITPIDPKKNESENVQALQFLISLLSEFKYGAHLLRKLFDPSGLSLKTDYSEAGD